MNTTAKTIVAALIGLIAGVGGTVAFSKSDRNGDGGMQHEMSNGQMMGGDSMGMQDEMDSMMAGLQGKAGDAFDQEFLSEMIVHHQGAVQMAEAALKDAKHQEIKDLAQKIIAAQNGEIKQMQDWQVAWYGVQKPLESGKARQ